MTLILCGLLVTTGILALAISAIGAIRLPDFYTRSHAIGVMDTLGVLLVVAGLIVYHGFGLVSAKLFFVFAFIYIANPTVTHAMVRAAMRSGLPAMRNKTGASS